ncbi:MAG: hypothetical protein IJ761_05495 [Bacteroidales bacterium]|nr:hypothetical protein [Bacteroidales bacterium]
MDNIVVALDRFIRDYYKNLVVRGSLQSVALMGSLFLVAVLSEHWGWFPSAVRGVLFWTLLFVALIAVGWLVVRPWLKMHRLGHRISREQAAKIIGQHFPEVDDKLLNLLQLMGDAPPDADDNHNLLLACIEQKRLQLQPVTFKEAINFRFNRRLLKYAVPPIAVIAVLLMCAPHTVTDPSQRIIHYGSVFERPAPFSFEVCNPLLSCLQGNDFTLEVTTHGEAQPSEVDILLPQRTHRMKVVGNNRFQFTFRQVQTDIYFTLSGGGVNSAPMVIDVDKRPTVSSLQLHITPPSYTGLAASKIEAVGDATVPEGSVLQWNIITQEADSVSLGIICPSIVRINTHAVQRGATRFSHTATASVNYFITAQKSARNGQTTTTDTMTYGLAVVPDAFPQISVTEAIDSAFPDRRIFVGRIADDYGFSGLRFCNVVQSIDALSVPDTTSVGLAISTDANQEFYFTFNTAALALQPGDRLTYWFEVSDNDALHGAKTSRSQPFELLVPTEGEIAQKIERNSSEATSRASAQLSALQQMQREIDNMIRQLIDKKNLDWQDRQNLRQLAEKQRAVQQQMQQVRQQMQENRRLEEKYLTPNEELVKKQQELDRLMNEVMDEKMKQTLNEIDRLLHEADKQKVQQQLEQLKTDNKSLEQQLDQNIELMKRLELEKQTEQAIEKLNQMAEEQRQLSEQTRQSTHADTNIQKRQSQLNQRFEQTKQEIERLEQEHKTLNKDSRFEISDTLKQQIERHQQKATQQLQKGKNQQAADEQHDAAEKMKKMADDMEQAMADDEQAQLAEDADMIRQMLKNLLSLSFKQEDLISRLNTTYIQDPAYQSIISTQHQIAVDFRNVDDSLHAIARRQINVASAIGKETDAVKANLRRSQDRLLDMNQGFYGGYKNYNASSSMQYSMTSLNNLALILAESLEHMQDQMRNNNQKGQKSKSPNNSKNQQQCNSPGKNPSPRSMREMQEQLNRQLEALKKQLDKEGQGRTMPHKTGQGQSLSEEIARAVAQQEMIRRMMEQYANDMKQLQPNNAKLAKELQEMMRQMEHTEVELVNRTLTSQTLQRQQQITTRMLEHENADLQREKDNQRESREANGLYSQPSPAELQKNKQAIGNTTSPLLSLPPNFTPFYRKKANSYFYQK